ncbi:MAG: hypothetical protein OXN84_05770, partial [Albidovulum sp.]|nr:hypothetical protein [Albidovulum sp.]
RRAGSPRVPPDISRRATWEAVKVRLSALFGILWIQLAPGGSEAPRSTPDPSSDVTGSPANRIQVPSQAVI